MASRDDLPRPPEPPRLDRRLRLGRFQWFGALLLLAVPALALAGVFGERYATASARSAELELHVEWPTRTRHEMIHDVEVRVRNVSARPIDTLVVALDTTYLAAFSAITATPAAARPWEIELIDVRPGEVRHVVVEVDAQRYWRHSGRAIATSGGSDTASVTISTLIFP